MKLQLFSLFSLVLLISSSFRTTTRRTCKCQPDSWYCWPTGWEWSRLSRSLSSPGRLLFDQHPMGAVCYPKDPFYDPVACQSLNSTLHGFDFVFMSSRINATNFYNYDSIITPGKEAGCPYSPLSPNSVCEQGRVPPYVVNASTTQDIVEAVKFASKKNLRLVVKNTGHEAIGRAFGVGALAIFTYNMKNLTVHNNFVPKGAPRGTPPVPAMTVGAGVNWDQAYAAADAAGRTIAGGFAPMGTVGTAGWNLGTGHSLLSSSFGLGVDNSLEFTVVLPDASVVTVNEYLTPDLYWAIRGGGGPSFGVVVDITIKLHEAKKYTGAFYESNCNSDACFLNLLTTWMKYVNAVSDAGWSGIWPTCNHTLYLTFGTPYDVAPSRHTINVLKEFMEEAKKIPGNNVTVSTFRDYVSFEDFCDKNLKQDPNAVGFNLTEIVYGQVQLVTSSWLLPREATAPENAAKMAKAVASVDSAVVIPFQVGGGVVNDLTKKSTSAANPAWRNTLVDITIAETGSASDDINVLQKTVHDDIAPFRAMAPPPYGGMYLNEADILEEEWQAAQWGDQYPRLLKIKKRIDPKDLLIVRMGVNSEGWDDEIICKTIETTLAAHAFTSITEIASVWVLVIVLILTLISLNWYLQLVDTTPVISLFQAFANRPPISPQNGKTQNGKAARAKDN
ncbi:hypothetical protein D9758_015737 [Tetrapyrgos nigripes]|uniref:FAD-binding PCMH-type domain-containing protein n=1 Tax=Tetrapyrgos nigripes TaxID=182062 RepID=A0A8H5CUC1_9AGAR|nr:hypothetical protein D9758_015737 [Tetrapyrgos nigripes]